MGTETKSNNFCDFIITFEEVKLNNPLIGTETTSSR